MAKKKGVNKVGVATGLGIGVVIAISVVFVTGIGFDFVVPQDVEGLEIPVLTQSEIQQIQVIIDRIREIPNEELGDAVICLELELELELNPELVEFCDRLLQSAQLDAQLLDDTLKRIEALEMEIEAILPPPDLNNTESSIDPPPVQICDEIDCPDLPPIIPPTSIIVLSTAITKIDSNGTAELVEDAFDIPIASFFVEQETNIDYSTGRLQIKLAIKGDPTTTYIGTGKIDLLINNQTILSAPLDVQVNGMGEVDLLFGGISDTFTFSFADNFDKFLNQQNTPITVVVKELNIAGGTDSFSLSDQTVFVMNILRDDFRILIDDEQGITMRVYPTDSVLKVTGATTAVKGIRCALYFKHTEGLQVQAERGSRSAPTDPSGCYVTLAIVTIGTETPALIGLNLLDGSGNLLNTFAGGKGEVVNELLQRNANYTLTIASPAFSTDLSFPKSQQTQSYTCTNEYKINYIKDRKTTINGGTTVVKHTLVPDSYSITKVNCNFPN